MNHDQHVSFTVRAVQSCEALMLVPSFFRWWAPGPAAEWRFNLKPKSGCQSHLCWFTGKPESGWQPQWQIRTINLGGALNSILPTTLPNPRYNQDCARESNLQYWTVSLCSFTYRRQPNGYKCLSWCVFLYTIWSSYWKSGLAAHCKCLLTYP